MTGAGADIRPGLRWGVLTLVAVVTATSFTIDTADARRRARSKAPAVERIVPAYASLVVDANTGAVLQSSDASSPRFPASLTKIMTLYLLFERIESGSIKLNTELPVSAHAAKQAPSKLGLKPGQTIAVEDAIKAIVTKSANDIAVVVAEALASDEEDFARLMTRKARALGMHNTTYRNASGLPDMEQKTTAEDQVLLGRAIQDRFPRYYRYFSTRAYEFRGQAMRNHNKLLGAIEGVDGIKTGYTNASGFNLVTSVRRGGRYIVAAVFGGRSGNARDAQMKTLINRYIQTASLKRTAPVIAEAADATVPRSRVQVAAAAMGAAIAGASPIAASVPAPAVAAAPPAPPPPQPGSTEPIKPNAVKTVAVKAASLPTTTTVPASLPSGTLARSKTGSGLPVQNITTVKADPPPGSRPGVLGVLPAKFASAGDTAVTATVSASSTKPPRSGWMIQVGAYDDEGEAKQKLGVAKTKAKELASAEAFTETVTKGDKVLYRARFAGLEKDEAETACKHLKDSDIACMLLKD